MLCYYHANEARRHACLGTAHPTNHPALASRPGHLLDSRGRLRDGSRQRREPVLPESRGHGHHPIPVSGCCICLPSSHGCQPRVRYLQRAVTASVVTLHNSVHLTASITHPRPTNPLPPPPPPPTPPNPSSQPPLRRRLRPLHRRHHPRGPPPLGPHRGPAHLRRGMSAGGRRSRHGVPPHRQAVRVLFGLGRDELRPRLRVARGRAAPLGTAGAPGATACGAEADQGARAQHR